MTKGLVIGTGLGLIWGFVISVLVGISLTLVFGVQASMTAWQAGLAGGAAALTWLFAGQGGDQSPRRYAIAALVFAVVLLALTFVAPLGISPDNRPLAAVFALVLMAGLTVLAIGIPFTGKDWRTLNRYRAEEVVTRALKAFGLVFFSVIVILPFYVMVMTSLKMQSELLLNPLDYSIDILQGPSGLFSSYIELFTTYNFGRYILTTFFVSALTVVLTLAASIPGAYAISRLNFPGRLMFSRSILLIYMVPAIVLVIPLYAVFSQLGLRDSLLGLLIVYPATTIPVALYMLQGYFRGIPNELEEAGLMDGCSRIGVIRRITLPLSRAAKAAR
ncbi:MAG: carbohydrate ABC transporter permease, partial [Pseudomonadota bacterium]